MADLIVVCGPQAVGKMVVAESLRDKLKFNMMMNHDSIEVSDRIFGFATPAQKEFNAFFREKAFELAVKHDVDLVFTYVCAFEMQSERDHNIQSEKSDVGPYNGRKYRHASGWFSYDVAVSPTLQNEIQLDFWGGDVRKVSMELDGKEIAVIELNNDKPGQFFTRSFDVPKELTAGKTKATLKFVASSHSLAGGVLGSAC